MMVSFLRAIKFTLQQIRRNLWLSIVTITLLILPLLSVNIIIALGALTKAATVGIQDKIDISVYFKSSATDEQAQVVREQLLKLPEVKAVDYTTREGAIARFKERHVNDPIILESLNELGDNPFGATIAIKADKVENYNKILQILEQPNYAELIEEKNFDDHRVTIERINKIMTNVQSFGIGVAAIFGLIAILIVVNSIKMGIYTHRDEIGIMRLVGAGGWFVRAPFLLEALFFSFLSMLITMLIMYPCLNFIQPYLNNLFEGMDVNLISYFNSHFLIIVGGQFLGIALLTIFSTGLAMRRYLKV